MLHVWMDVGDWCETVRRNVFAELNPDLLRLCSWIRSKDVKVLAMDFVKQREKKVENADEVVELK